MKYKVFLFLSLSASVFGQIAVQQFAAEVPDAFGSVAGRIVLAGDQLIFSSDTKPEASFAATRRDIQGVTIDADVITLQLRSPYRDASGERNRLLIRVAEQPAHSAVNAWFNLRPAPSAPAGTPGQEPELRSFEVQRKKMFGGSKGRLLVTQTGLAYESIDDVKDSRRWQFSDIKELKLKSPYQLEVQPFSGDKYEFAIEGQGMGNADYQELIDRVTQARAAPRR